MKTTPFILWQLLAMLTTWQYTIAQTDRDCIEEILLLDRFGKQNDSSDTKTTFFSYTIRATNWDDETAVSNVKLYQKNGYMHLSSEQAQIYMDEQEALIIVPEQKVLIINPLDKSNPTSGLSDDFLEIRKTFLKSCVISSCDAPAPDHKILALKSSPTNDPIGSSIENMIYDYNPVLKKINSVRITYSTDYRLKQLVMIYRKYNSDVSYSFMPVKKYYADAKGRIKNTFKEFEIMDNREKSIK